MLWKYVRDKKRHKVGMVVAVDKGLVGWSICHPKKEGKFDLVRGTEIAVGRAMTGSVVKIPGGYGLPFAISEMLDRSKRYYKDTQVSV